MAITPTATRANRTRRNTVSFISLFFFHIESLGRAGVVHQRVRGAEAEQIQEGIVEIAHAAADVHGQQEGEDQTPAGIVQEVHQTAEEQGEHRERRQQGDEGSFAVDVDLRHATIGDGHGKAVGQLLPGQQLVGDPVHQLVPDQIADEQEHQQQQLRDRKDHGEARQMQPRQHKDQNDYHDGNGGQIHDQAEFFVARVDQQGLAVAGGQGRFIGLFHRTFPHMWLRARTKNATMASQMRNRTAQITVITMNQILRFLRLSLPLGAVMNSTRLRIKNASSGTGRMRKIRISRSTKNSDTEDQDMSHTPFGGVVFDIIPYCREQCNGRLKNALRTKPGVHKDTRRTMYSTHAERDERLRA